MSQETTNNGQNQSQAQNNNQNNQQPGFLRRNWMWITGATAGVAAVAGAAYYFLIRK